MESSIISVIIGSGVTVILSVCGCFFVLNKQIGRLEGTVSGLLSRESDFEGRTTERIEGLEKRVDTILETMR